MANNNNANDANDEVLAKSKSNQSIADLFEDNKDMITYVLIGILVLAGAYLLYRQMVMIPQEKEAIEQMAQAQMQFERDSFQVALANPGNSYPGFIDIADEYSGTPTGNMALYYAGISYLNLGNFEVAIDYLEDFNPSGDITPSMRAGALGDAYSETSNLDEALSYYNSAVGKSSNGLISAYYLKKVGMLNEHMGNPDAARKAYQIIKDEYFNTAVSRDIDKYLARVGG